MWNNLTGNIPKEVGNITTLKLILVDNNNLSGPLPPELAETQSLEILQADNNNFSGSSIPAEYSGIQTLLKLLQGAVPDLSGIPNFGYL
nr:unnamed protein product [Digitaria exilis]